MVYHPIELAVNHSTLLTPQTLMKQELHIKASDYQTKKFLFHDQTDELVVFSDGLPKMNSMATQYRLDFIQQDHQFFLAPPLPQASQAVCQTAKRSHLSYQAQQLLLQAISPEGHPEDSLGLHLT